MSALVVGFAGSVRQETPLALQVKEAVKEALAEHRADLEAAYWNFRALRNEGQSEMDAFKAAFILVGLK